MSDKVFFAAHRFTAGANDAPADPINAVEQHLLGTLLAKPSLLEELPPGFGAQHFLNPDHVSVFEAIKATAATGATFITPLVRAALPHLEDSDEDGKPTSYVVTLVAAMVATLPGMARSYAQSIMDAADRRDLLAVAEGIRRDAAPVSGEPAEPSAVIAKATLAFERIMARQRKWKAAVTLDAAMAEAVAIGEEAAERNGLAGIGTGLACVDERLDGLERGCYYVLAGRPGMGKSALGFQICVSAAATEGRKTLVISQEMKSFQLGRRALAMASGVNAKAIKQGRFSKDDGMASALVTARQEWGGLPLLIEDEPRLTPTAVAFRAKAAKRRMGGLDLIMIDHIHIMEAPENVARRDRVQQLTELSMGVKAIAKEFDVPVVALSQLSRGVEQREDKRPILSDLRESGSIEQDADVVMFLYREEYYLAKAGEERRAGEGEEKYQERISTQQARMHAARGAAELIFAKVRDGETGTEHLRFDGPRTWFSEGRGLVA